MERRHRTSSTPLPGRERPITHLNPSQRTILELLEPSLSFKYLSNQWLSQFLDIHTINTSINTAVLRENGYLHYPSWQVEESQNYLAKSNIYELTTKGKKAITTGPRHSHRSNSFRHEVMIDMGFSAPLYLYAKRNPEFRLLRAADILNHPEIPAQLRRSDKPFTIKPNTIDRRFDGTPHIIGYQDRRALILLEADMGTENLEASKDTDRTTLASHISEIITCMKHKYIAEHYDIQHDPTGILICLLFSNHIRTNSAMRYILETYGQVPYLLFTHHPDITRQQFFPRPNTDIITTPWLRLGTLKPYLLSELREA